MANVSNCEGTINFVSAVSSKISKFVQKQDLFIYNETNNEDAIQITKEN